jgi:hypothetical protein
VRKGKKARATTLELWKPEQGQEAMLAVLGPLLVIAAAVVVAVVMDAAVQLIAIVIAEKVTATAELVAAVDAGNVVVAA